jgi:hypothetical protein
VRLLRCTHFLGIALVLSIALLASCKEKRELPPAADYKVFIQGSAQVICEKMIECYSGLFFSISPELRSGINVESCKETALRDLDFKLSRHSDAMKKLSVTCYQAILDSPCKEVGTTFFWNPACFALRAESEKAYRGVAPPVLPASKEK